MEQQELDMQNLHSCEYCGIDGTDFEAITSRFEIKEEGGGVTYEETFYVCSKCQEAFEDEQEKLHKEFYS